MHQASSSGGNWPRRNFEFNLGARSHLGWCVLPDPGYGLDQPSVEQRGNGFRRAGWTSVKCTAALPPSAIGALLRWAGDLLSYNATCKKYLSPIKVSFQLYLSLSRL